MDSATENWLRLAEYDLVTAEAMLAAGRTLYVVFACQQAAEKALKALVAEGIGAMPPRTHDLLLLATRSGSDAGVRFADLLTYLNQSFMAVRYPMDLDRAVQSYPLDAVAPLIPRSSSRELLAWIRSRLP